MFGLKANRWMMRFIVTVRRVHVFMTLELTISGTKTRGVGLARLAIITSTTQDWSVKHFDWFGASQCE
jgi:hypothetical protein